MISLRVPAIIPPVDVSDYHKKLNLLTVALISSYLKKGADLNDILSYVNDYGEKDFITYYKHYLNSNKRYSKLWLAKNSVLIVSFIHINISVIIQT